MENQYHLLGILKILIKWRKQILYACLATAIGSALISLLLPVYFAYYFLIDEAEF